MFVGPDAGEAIVPPRGPRAGHTPSRCSSPARCGDYPGRPSALSRSARPSRLGRPLAGRRPEGVREQEGAVRRDELHSAGARGQGEAPGTRGVDGIALPPFGGPVRLDEPTLRGGQEVAHVLRTVPDGAPEEERPAPDVEEPERVTAPSLGAPLLAFAKERAQVHLPQDALV